MNGTRICTAEACERDVSARGMCLMHYKRWRKTVPDMAALRPSPRDRFNASIRRADGCWEWLGCKTPKGYGYFTAEGVTRRAHRASYEIFVGPIPEGLHIDHTCHNRGCVNPAHLRPVTNKQNAENRAGAQANNRSSGVRGVGRDAWTGKWKVTLQHHGKRHYFGLFEDLEEAAAVARRERARLFTHSDMDKDTK